MYLGRTKIFIIAFLIILSIYQTANLWFENISNYRFFYYFKSLSNLQTEKSQVEYAEKSIIINIGNDKFIQNFNNISRSNAKQVFDEVISIAIRKGKFYQAENFDISTILNNKCVIYKYDYSTTGSEISTIFKSYSKNSLKIESFDLICIVPNVSKRDEVQVIFFDTKNSKQYEFILNTSQGAKVYNIINKFSLEEDHYYISSFKNGFDLFDKNLFILTWDTNHFNYNNILVQNPISIDENISQDILEDYIDVFFQNPSIKWHVNAEDTSTYSDESTVVKYNKAGILEYSNYKSGTSQSNKGIFDLYTIAINFLNTDTNIKNEYYLKKYIEDQDKVTFYFDYKINNLPINLAMQTKEKFSMDSMIEVTVSQSKVSKYKRIIFDFFISSQESYLSKDFLNAIDNVIYKQYKNDLYSIKDVELAYNFDINKKENILYTGWFIETKDGIFFEN